MAPAARPARRPRRLDRGGGFTLIELMVVIGIIVVLAAILLPVVSRVRQTAYDTSTQQQMQRIMQACQQYFHDFNSYPGPVANVNLAGGSSAVAPGVGILKVTANNGATGITSSENLVLGLLGYLDPPASGSGLPPSYNQPGTAGPPPHDVLSLNPLRPAKYSYLDYTPGELSNGNAGSLEALAGKLVISDTNIPEFVDRFTNPMPILYIRAFVGGTGTPQASPTDTVPVGGAPQFVQYDYMELSPYGCNIQTGTGPVAANLNDSYFTTLTSQALVDSAMAYADWNGQKASGGGYDGYLTNSNIAGPGGSASQATTGGAVRAKDGFILISAGRDRTYGTHDDTIVTP